MAIDTLKALVRNALKKTGDQMISGYLTLFQGPTEDLHAATKKYVDDAIAAIPPPVGSGSNDINYFRYVNGKNPDLVADLGIVAGQNPNWGDTGTGATMIPLDHTLYVMRYVQPRAQVIQQFDINVTVSGANSVAWFVMYNYGEYGSLDILPNTVFHDSRVASGGFVNMAGGAGVKTYTPSGGLIVPAGYYWLGMATNHGDPTVSTSTLTALTAQRQDLIGMGTTFQPVQHLQQAGLVTGPAPDPWGNTVIFGNGSVPMIRVTYSG